MTNPNIRIKRSAVEGKRPEISQLEFGELALNTNDGRLFARKYNVGIGSTVTLLNVWTENVGGGAYYNEGNIGIGSTNPTSKLSVVGDGNFTGVVTATTFFGALTGTATTASSVTANSVGLGTHTYGDYVKDITGTANQITVTSGTGEGSSPTLSIPNQFTAPQDVTVTRDLQVNRNLHVNGNITIGGTSATLFTTEFKVYDPDIVLGFRTDGSDKDISTDNTANHGGIAIASTEGTPLIDLYDVGIGETNPTTYKKFMWFKSGTFSGLGTDAWISNYAIGIGSTQVPNGVRLAAGGMQVTDRTLSIPQLNISGVSTFTGAVSFGTSAYFGDNDTLNFGDGNDLRIYHDGSDSFIEDAGTGNLYLRSNSAGIILQKTSGNENLAKFLTDGAVELYYDNTKEFETTGYGATVFGILQSQGLNITGVSTFRNTLVLNNSSGDGEIFNDTGNIFIKTARELRIMDSTAAKYLARFDALSAGSERVFLYHSNNVRLETIGSGVTVTGTLFANQLNISGISTFSNGPVIVGSGTSTGTPGQIFQVSGINSSVYVGGNIGIGSTNPTSKLSVVGDGYFTGVVTASSFSGGPLSGDSGTFTSLNVTGNTNISGIATANTFDIGIDAGISTTRTVVATTSPTAIESFSASTYRSARIQVQITQGTSYQASDILIIHDGTTANLIEYGSIATGSYLGNFTADINSGNARLLISMGTSTSATVKVLTQKIKV
jgi:hypothetical protein